MQMQRDTLEVFFGPLPACLRTFRYRMQKTVFQMLFNFSSSTKNRNKKKCFGKYVFLRFCSTICNFLMNILNEKKIHFFDRQGFVITIVE